MVVDIFLDTPDLKAYERHKHVITGGTTNPSLMSKMGIPPEQYEAHCKKILEILGPSGVLSVEVTEVLPNLMYEQVQQFKKWGEQRIVVKIPSPFYLDETLVKRVHGGATDISTGDKQFASLISHSEIKTQANHRIIYVDTLPVIAEITKQGIPLNVTCGFAYEQAHDIAATIRRAITGMKCAAENYFSIFWGRILDGYVEDKNLDISKTYNKDDLEKMIALSTQEVVDTAKQLEGSNIRVILGSSRLPKAWEEAAKKDEAQLQHLRREAYRAVLKVAQPVNAIPTVPPALIEAGRYHASTANAVKGFVEDYLKLLESK